MQINNMRVKMLLDMGSDILIVNETTWKEIGKPLLKRTCKVATSVYGKKLFCGEELR